MPRLSSRPDPPSTTRGPWQTSPSGVATGEPVTAAAATASAYEGASHAPAMSGRIASAYGPVTRHHRCQRHEAGDRRLLAGSGRGHLAGHHETAPPGVVLPHEGDAARRLVVARHDHVLQGIAQAGLDGPLVPRRHLQVVGHGTRLPHGAGRIRQHQARRIAVRRPRGLELLERLQAGGRLGEFLLALAQRQAEAVALGAQRGGLGVAGGAVAA